MSRDFSKGKIYKITNDYNDDVYVGSTCDILGKRFSRHKVDMKREKNKNIPIYKLMNEIGFERFRIQLIIDYPCEDVYQLTQKEGEYIRLLGTLNKRVEGRTMIDKQEYEKNYKKKNKDKIKIRQEQYDKKRYESNRQILLENIKCVCGCEVVNCGLQRHMKTKKHNNVMEQLSNTSNNEIVV